MSVSAPSTIADSLARLALRFPSATAVFQRHHLDYCCQGGRSLALAATSADLDPEAILEAIVVADRRRGAGQRNWEEAALGDVIDHLLNSYHEPHRQELTDLQAMATKVERVHGEKATCPHGLAHLLSVIETDMLEHMAKEEDILFPLIRSGQGASCLGPVRVMEAEHHDHGDNLQRLSELTNTFQPPVGACTTWRALYLRLEQFRNDLMDHIHLENHVLFPRALNS